MNVGDCGVEVALVLLYPEADPFRFAAGDQCRARAATWVEHVIAWKSRTFNESLEEFDWFLRRVDTLLPRDSSNINNVCRRGIKAALSFGRIEDVLRCEAEAGGAPRCHPFGLRLLPDDGTAEGDPSYLGGDSFEPVEVVDVAKEE